MEIKFKNVEVSIKKLKRGTVVALEDDYDGGELCYYHIDSFDCVHDNIAWLVLTDKHGIVEYTSDDLIWPE